MIISCKRRSSVTKGHSTSAVQWIFAMSEYGDQTHMPMWSINVTLLEPMCFVQSPVKKCTVHSSLVKKPSGRLHTHTPAFCRGRTRLRSCSFPHVPALPLPEVSLILNAAQERCLNIEIGSATCLCASILGVNTKNAKDKTGYIQFSCTIFIPQTRLSLDKLN